MSVQIYPVQETQSVCHDYTVKLNGQPVALDTARVSAEPFNRRWPGHQRQISQTELINFLSLAADQPVSFEITPTMPFEDVVIRPLSLGIQSTVKNGTISFVLEKASYFTVEPYGRNHALHIFVDPLQKYAPDLTDENLLYFGPGEHDAGDIIMTDNQTLYLDAGAVVYGCIYATDAENIKILGRGILDNSRNKAKILFSHNAENNDTAINNAKRKHTVQLEYCTNVTIEGITIRDSLVYNIRPLGCKHLHISNVKIIGCWRYNSDGIDMHNCEDVRIENCFLRTFDDSICIKGFDCYYAGDVEAAVRAAMYRNGKAYDVFKDVIVRNCTIWNDWGKCLEIGAETRAEEICNIVFENCDIIHVTDYVLDCCNVDYADVHDVVYRNINIEFDNVIPAPSIQKKDADTYPIKDPDYVPMTISVNTLFHHEYSAGGTRRGINRDILFRNIHIYGRQQPRLLFNGYDETHKTHNITVENLYWNGNLLPSLSREQLICNEFTENIGYRTSEYAQTRKNTVTSKNQLGDTNVVRFYNPYGTGKRVMFVGNSITLHGYLPQIGWYNECGMAASALEKDYVHLLMAQITQNDPDAAFCICQVAEWERQFQTGSCVYPLFEQARNFQADVIIVRFIENCSLENFDCSVFKAETAKLLGYLSGSSSPKFIFTTGFWKHPGDLAFEELAAEANAPLVPLGDLGEDDRMKAVGLFEHKGVAHHPGDLGMQTIADRILPALRNCL